jgi:hypothetical protein
MIFSYVIGIYRMAALSPSPFNDFSFCDTWSVSVSLVLYNVDVDSSTDAEIPRLMGWGLNWTFASRVL